MKVSLWHLWKIKVDDNIYSLDVYATCEQVAANQVTAHAFSEIMKHTVAVFLNKTKTKMNVNNYGRDAQTN